MVIAHNINEGLRTQDVKIKEDITFESILLAKNTLSGLKKAGFYKPSPIQLHGIPMGKCGFDLLLEAKSGTGKTAVFTVIALEKIDLHKGLQVIMMAPTREIAAQICSVIREIGADYAGLGVEVVMGGLPLQEDVFKLRSKQVHIVVGSPGRLKHLIIDKYLDVSSVRLLVLDECDKLVERSFLSDITTIFSNMPKQKQVIMSSATYPDNCKSFISKFVHNAQHICPDSTTILLGITQKVTLVKNNNNIVKQTQNRLQELLKILTTKQFRQCLIFCNYQARVAELHKLLTKEKWPVELLYGQQEQNNRLDALKTLQDYKCRLLISTDLAARGIDASNVDLVINFEPPFDWQTYLHRIGRAGRYGSFGTAITILCEGKEATTFKELFCSINVSLNLTNLWTNNEFRNQIQDNSNSSDVDKSEFIQPEKENTSDERSKTLWNLLTSETENNIECIQTFDEIQKSFEILCSPHENVESFTDLLASFEQPSCLAKGNIKYSQIKITQIPIKYYLSCSQDEDDNDIRFNESSNISNSNDNIIKPLPSVSNEASNNVEPSNLSNIPSEFYDLYEEYNCDYPSKIVKPETKSLQYNSEIYPANENITNDYSIGDRNPLVEAGLPTSFGKIRNKNNSNNIFLKKCDTNVINKKEVLNSENSGTRADKMNTTSKLKSQRNSKRYGKLSSGHINNTDSRKSSKKPHLNYNSAIHDDFKNYTALYEKQNKNIYDEHYRNWLNQLEMHKKYIEYIVYLEEMSKL